MRIIKIIFMVLVICLAGIHPISAQKTIVKASIDSTHLLIGQQTPIHLEVTTDKGNAVQLPVFGDTLTKGVEVLEMSVPDTTWLGNDRIQINLDYLVTSFDSALYVLPPLRVIDGLDTVYSNQLALKISTYPIDDGATEFFDIKDVWKPRFVWSDYLYIFLIILGILLLAAVGWYLYQVWKGKRSLRPFGQKAEPELPPHMQAIKELDEIKSKKLWQQGRIKEYHSQLTDTVRIYIEKRFETPAMEMTSGEILNKIKYLSDADSVYDNLKQILQLADFVKFAKFNPLPDENELSLMNAYLFVNQTKLEEVEPVQQESVQEQEKEMPKTGEICEGKTEKEPNGKEKDSGSGQEG